MHFRTKPTQSIKFWIWFILNLRKLIFIFIFKLSIVYFFSQSHSKAFYILVYIHIVYILVRTINNENYYSTLVNKSVWNKFIFKKILGRVDKHFQGGSKSPNSKWKLTHKFIFIKFTPYLVTSWSCLFAIRQCYMTS